MVSGSLATAILPRTLSPTEVRFFTDQNCNTLADGGDIPDTVCSTLPPSSASVVMGPGVDSITLSGPNTGDSLCGGPVLQTISFSTACQTIK